MADGEAAEAAVMGVLRGSRGRDVYEMSGMTGLPLSAVERAIATLVAAGRIGLAPGGRLGRYAVRPARDGR